MKLAKNLTYSHEKDLKNYKILINYNLWEELCKLR